MNTTPYNYQREDAIQIQAWDGRALLANEPGTGKSLTAFLWAWKHIKAAWPILVVCPAGLKWNWAREAQMHFNWRSAILETNIARLPMLTGQEVVIINYDVLDSWWRVLRRKYKPKLVILDECHLIKSLVAKRTLATHNLCKRTPHVIALSGTPITNRPAELWSTLHILQPKLWPNFYKYAHRYCQPRKFRGHWQFKGAAHLPQLHRKLCEHVMIRRRKKDVLKDLPPKARYVVPLETSKPKLYEQALKGFRKFLATHDPHSSENHARTLAGIGHLKRLAARLKLPGVYAWVDNFLEETDVKLILFAIHKKIIAKLKKRYGKLAVVVDGSVTGRKRQQFYDSFTKNKSIRILIGNITAAGVGWNGVAASTVAFAEMAWTPGEHVQAEGRIERIGAKRRLTSYYLVAKGTIEEDICRLIQKKQLVLEQTLDGVAMGDLSVYDDLIKQLAA